MSGRSHDWNDEDRDLATRKKEKTKKPRLYKVLLHNDDYTTREFVVDILVDIFHKPHAEAQAIMLHVHYKGIGVAGIYTRDVADTKVQQVIERAEQDGMPLLCTMEPE